MPYKPKIIAIIGPTASGKSSLALKLAAQIGKTDQAGSSEIVSADSRQIYRGMDVGTAKPTVAEMAEVPHHLIDIKNPDEDYTVAEYKSDAIAAINDIIARKRIPLLVGGTGLYVQAVVQNLDIPNVGSDAILRAQIEKEIETDGLDAVFQKLLTLDPEAEYIVDRKNPRRVMRALEVATLTGKPFTAQRKKSDPLFDTLILGLNPAPELLRERINARVEKMFHDGLVEETSTLIKKYGDNQVVFDTIGYREVIDHLEGKISLEEAVAQIKLDTWHYAKRQMTWFKKDPTIQWVQNDEEALSLAQKFLQ